MAQLKGKGALQRDADMSGGTDDITSTFQAPPPPMMPPQLGGGGESGGQGNSQKPIDRNPNVPTTPGNRGGNTPTVSTEPIVGDSPRSFLGGGNNTMSPPSVTQQAPFMSMSSPAPESMVFPQGGGRGLFGNSGGQFGGGLGLGQGAQAPGKEDPSSLIKSLLQLLGQ